MIQQLIFFHYVTMASKMQLYVLLYCLSNCKSNCIIEITCIFCMYNIQSLSNTSVS